MIQSGPADEDEQNNCVSLPHGDSLDSSSKSFLIAQFHKCQNSFTSANQVGVRLFSCQTNGSCAGASISALSFKGIRVHGIPDLDAQDSLTSSDLRS